MSSERSKPTIARLVPQQLALLLFAPLLLWPALVNGGAFFFPDTPSYIRSIDALAVRLIDRPSEWTSARTLYVAHTVEAAPAVATGSTKSVGARPAPDAAHAVDRPVLAGRSPFYGGLAYLGVLFGSFWAVILIQALLATGVLIGTIRHAVSPAQHRLFAISVAGAMAVAMLTALPFYASMIMPDIFAGLAIVAAAVLLSGWRRETAAGRWGWIAIAAYGALTHSATLLILIGMLAAAALLWIVRRPVAPRVAAIAGLAAAVSIGIAGEVACSRVIERATGQPPIRPPFITARLTADRVGTDYLRTHCDNSRWVLCRFSERLPLHSDSFLWSPNPANGVFMAATPAERRALSAEQVPFVLAVLRDRPGAVIQSSGQAILDQASEVGLEEFQYTPEEYADFVRTIPAATSRDMRQTAAYRRTVPTDLVVMLAWPLLFASILAIAWAYRRAELRDQAVLGSYVAFGWLLNVVICGALSTPHERYNMRVLWMLPMVAVVIAAVALTRQRRPGRADSAGTSAAV